MPRRFSIFFICCCLIAGCGGMLQQRPLLLQQHTENPVLPGDFADPFIISYRDTFYIYATTGNEATVWRSADFRNWKLTKLNWPTSMGLPDIWAPAVTRGVDGRFYLYTSVNHNIYAGVADHPMGPFRNILGGDSIFIKNRQWWNKMHSIDADCFVDEDGQAYLYWGSGFDFKDGICAVGKLGKDMASFTEPPKLITPPGYFEGPHMLKRNGRYYLMYSDGLFYDSSYKVRYAVAQNPTGPFTGGKNSAVFVTDTGSRISGPGHHSTIKIGNEDYIVYHRHAQPLYAPYWGPIRQVCIDKMEYEADGSIKKIIGTWKNIPLAIKAGPGAQKELVPVSVSASAAISHHFDAAKAFDNSYGTLWAADKKMLPLTITADFGATVSIGATAPVFVLVMGDYRYQIEYAGEDRQWKPAAGGDNAMAAEWPVRHSLDIDARYLRLTILSQTREPNRAGLWEWEVYGK